MAPGGGQHLPRLDIQRGVGGGAAAGAGEVGSGSGIAGGGVAGLADGATAAAAMVSAGAREGAGLLSQEPQGDQREHREEHAGHDGRAAQPDATDRDRKRNRLRHGRVGAPEREARRRQRAARHPRRRGRPFGRHEAGEDLLLERGHRPMTVAGRAGESAHDELLHVARQLGAQLTDGPRVLARLALQHIHRVLARAGLRGGQHLVEQAAEGVDVRQRIGGLAGRLLGRHVGGRADRDVGAGEGGAGGQIEILRDPEVEHLDEVRLVVPVHQHDVGRLQIAVDDLGRVRRLQRARDLRRHQESPLDRQRPVLEDQILEVDAVEELHDEVERAVGRGPRIGHVDDVRVADLRGGARLAPEPLDQIGAVVKAGVQHLDRHPAADVDVLRLVDPPHGPLAAEAADVVAPAQRGPDARILALPMRLVAERGRRRAEPRRGDAVPPESIARDPAISRSRSRFSSRASSAKRGRRKPARRSASVLGAVSARKPARSARSSSALG